MNINYTDDILNTKDLAARLEELEQSLAGLTPDQLNDVCEDVNELNELKAVRDTIGNDWLIGIELVNEDHYFESYVRDQEENNGTLDNIPSYIVIDWEQTAENIKSDYSVVDLMGATFYYQ